MRKEGNFVGEEARKATLEMFTECNPDAIFVANDHMAFSVLDTLRYELEIKVPEEVSIIGYDDVPAASWLSYNLTTVRQPVSKMVNRTVDILIQKIERPEINIKKIKIDGPLIIRKSAKTPKGNAYERLQ
jgi:DNA-binding LacI/PurR family transcriptional regulator